MSIGAVVLAAGQGTRMRSALPKVVHPLAGRPMVELGARRPRRAAGVGPHGGRRRARRRRRCATCCRPASTVAVQERAARHRRRRAGRPRGPRRRAAHVVIVACGDTPLLPADADRADGLRARAPSRRAATMLTAARRRRRRLRPGRARCRTGDVARVVEARDASPDELAIGEFNAGLYVFDRAALEAALAGLGTRQRAGRALPHRRARADRGARWPRSSPTTPRPPRGSTTGSTWPPARRPSSGACARS